jgi:hypothetical protein
MRKFLLFLSLFVSKVAFSQLNDNFTDGNFTLSPVWQGDISGFTVNTNKQLQTSSSTVSQNISLYTANSLATNAKWDFYIQLAFDPSSSNQARIYLVSDQSDFNGALNGYFVQIGESGNTDSYDLYKQSGTSITKIIDGPAKTRVSVDEVKARVQVTRDAQGLWELKTDISGGTAFTSEGTVTDMTFPNTAYFGVKSIYTATRSNLFIYDDFVVSELVPDVTPPILNSANTINGLQITLNFNEAVNAADASVLSNYTINPGNIKPTSVSVNGATVILNLANILTTNNYTLTVNTIKDLKGNTSNTPQNKSFFYKKPYLAKLNDIVINEIFADPSPQIDLPSVEFIELWNRSNEDIGLSGFKYSDPTSIYTFGNDSIKANQYLILCAKADTAEFKKFGKVIGLSPWPSLNNASDQLKLMNQNGDLIHQVNYSDSWYKDALKKIGGYTLELIDPLSGCKPSQNYAVSNDVSGGTPGKQNSIYLSNKITTPLQLLSVTLKDSVTVNLTFNRGLDSLPATLLSLYSINNGVGNPQAVNPIAPSFATVELKFNQALSRNQTYTVTVNGVTDCGSVTLTNQTLSFIYPGLIAKNDILINEILFNPKAGGVDFLEVYNQSDKTLDFKDLKLAMVNDQDSLISIKWISPNTLLFEPRTYWVITANPDTVKSQYQTTHPNNFIKIASLPSFNDDSGNAVILNQDNARIDQLNYHKSMQFALLKDLNGVSLERSSFSQATNATGNFRSAAASVGYATPADKNSQYLEDAIATEEISLVSPTFSPDNDGVEDVLRILYKLANPNKAANVIIYNDQGKLVKKLIRNETLSTEGEWIWDGLDEQNAKVKTGIYIIYAELFELNGNVKKYKKTAVVASKLN